MHRVDVDWADLELAFRDAVGTENWLDKETGGVVSVMAGFEDEADLRDALKRFPTRFARVVPIDKTFTRKALDAFAASLPPGALKKSLDDVREGSGGVARAIKVLHQSPRDWAQWARFEQAELWKAIEAFLAAQGLAPTTAATVDLFEGVAEGPPSPTTPPAPAKREKSSKRRASGR